MRPWLGVFPTPQTGKVLWGALGDGKCGGSVRAASPVRWGLGDGMKGASTGTKRWKNPDLGAGSSGLATATVGLAVSSPISELQGHGDTCGAPQLPPGRFLPCPARGCAFHTSAELWCRVGVAAPVPVPPPEPQAAGVGTLAPKFPLPGQSGFPPLPEVLWGLPLLWESLREVCPLLLSCQDPPGCSRLASRPMPCQGAKAKAFYRREGKD